MKGRLLLLAAVMAVAGVVFVAQTSAMATPKLNGTVGPGFTITLTKAGKKVTKLKAGVRYRFVVSDRSSAHDFHISGPSVNKVITGVGFTGTKSVVLKLKKGTYTFVCDPHSSFMRGSFKVS